MATRNLTSRYLQTRDAWRHTHPVAPEHDLTAAASSEHATADPLQPSVSDAAGVGVDDQTPPWIPIHEQVQADIKQIKENIRALQKLHAVRLKVSFGEGQAAGQQAEVDALTGEITTMLRKCENSIKQIAMVGNVDKLAVQERTARRNAMANLATEIAHISKTFKNIQKQFFINLKAQEKIGEQFFTSADGSSVALEDALNTGLSPGQVAELAQIAAQSNDREKEIIRIAQSVNELATLFKELNQLVIEQGTILDRIDYNIENSLTNIKKGVVDLEDAEERSKKALTMKCILIMAAIVLCLFLVFIIKKSA